MDMVTEIINVISAWLTGFWTIVANSINGAVALFYDGSVDGVGLTVLGILGLFGLAVGLIYFGIGFVRGFFVK